MLTTLTIVGVFTSFALVLQYFLNQLIQTDLDTLRRSRPQPDPAAELSGNSAGQ